MHNKLFTSFFLLFTIVISAQVPVGSWRSHLPASNFLHIGKLDSKIYAANSSGVLVYDMDEGSVFHLSKINQLVDAGISSFNCSEENGACVIGYENGNIDIITSSGQVRNQPALKNNPVVGKKAISEIMFHDKYAYIANGIGLLALDLESYNIASDRRFEYNGEKLELISLGEYRDSLFFASNKGVFKTPLDGLFETSEVIEINTSFDVNSIEQFQVFNEELIVLQQIDSLYTGDTLYKYQNNTLNKLEFQAGEGIRQLSVKGDSLIVVRPDNLALFNSNYEFQTSIFTYGVDGGIDTREAFFINVDDVIIADYKFGGIITSFKNQYNSSIFKVSSPSTDKISVIKSINGKVFGFPGGNERTYNQPLVHILENQQWKTVNLNNYQIPRIDNTNGIIELDNKYFVSTERQGIVQLNENYEAVKLFDYTNSSVQDAFPLNEGYEYGGITDITTSNGALYALNNIVAEPLIIRTTTNEWLSVKFDELPSPKTSDILATDNGILVLNMIDNGIIVYNTNYTPDDISDDSYRHLTSSPTAGNLPSNNVTCFEIDQDGELWIGTDAGIGVIYSLESVFTNNFGGAQQIIVNQDGYNGYLFATETIEAIAVDGADRKWIGTANSGLFLISADGQEQIHNFTRENSPLLSDKVFDLTIDGNTGEVFIASDKGLISYRSDATIGESELAEITIFPNPVKSTFTGEIAINNLTENSYVRITDSAGNLVYETQALGGQAVWTGLNKNGEKAPSGVYLVFAASTDGAEGKVGKILIL